MLSNKNPIVPQVVKQNYLRVSSLLMVLYPEDLLSKIYDEAGWAVGRPLIESREANNDFNLVDLVKQGLGLVSAGKTYGYYDHDKLISQLTGPKKTSALCVSADLKSKIESQVRSQSR